MKILGLEGDYCPTCASVLTQVKSGVKTLVVMCGSVCASVLQKSGDYDRLNAPDESKKKVVVEKNPDEKRSELRDPGESDQHKAEEAGYVKK